MLNEVYGQLNVCGSVTMLLRTIYFRSKKVYFKWPLSSVGRIVLAERPDNFHVKSVYLIKGDWAY